MPHILSQNPVEDFVENGTKSRLPSYSQNPTLAHTGCHRISSQRMDAALQQLMSMGAVSRKSLSGRDRPHALWSQTDADIHQPA